MFPYADAKAQTPDAYIPDAFEARMKVQQLQAEFVEIMSIWGEASLDAEKKKRIDALLQRFRQFTPVDFYAALEFVLPEHVFKDGLGVLNKPQDINSSPFLGLTFKGSIRQSYRDEVRVFVT